MILRKISLSDFPDLGEVDPTTLTDQKLLALDYLLHRAAKQQQNGGEVMINDKPWTPENIKDLHDAVVREMAGRGFTHAIYDENIQDSAPAAKDTDFANTTRDGSGETVNETVDAAQIAERAARAARMAQDANSPENQIDTANTTQPPILAAAEKQAKREGTIIQTIILDKKVFPTEAAAKVWAKKNGFQFGGVDETKESFRFRQRDPGDFDPDGFGRGEKFRTIRLTEGVQAVIGFVNKKSADATTSKTKAHAVLNGIVIQAAESKIPGIYKLSCGLDFQNMKVRRESIRSVNGKLYHEIGLALSTALDADVGDVVQIEFDGMNVIKNLADGTIAVTVRAPRAVGISKNSNAMTIGEAAKAARAGQILQSKEIAQVEPDLEKGIRQAFGSYGGKRFLAHRIASYVPHHRTYVEPFAGGGAVFFAKDPSPKEVLNDRDAEIAFMYRFIRDHKPEDRKALVKRDWVIRKETHERLKTMKPATDRDRFYKAFYLTRSSYGKQRGGPFNPANEGVKIDFPDNIERAQKRLQNAAIHNKDYLDILKKYDSPNTFFYMDPPYPGTFNLFDLGFKEESFLKALKSLKANWIVSYPVERAKVFKGYKVYRVKRRNQMKGPGGNQEWITEIMVSKFPLKPLHLYIEKELRPEPEGMEQDAPSFLPQFDDAPQELEKVQGAFKSPGGKYRLYKKLVPMIPEHKTFVEGFCGGAQIFFHKKRSDQEALNDVNADLIAAYRFIKGMTQEDLDWLKKQNWIITRKRAKDLFELKPRTPRERFYRFAYLNKAQYWGRTDVWEGMRPNGSTGIGARIRLADRLPQIQERLKGVKLHSWDWRDVIKEYDSPDTFFYLDPPYPLHWPKEKGKFGDKFFQEKDMIPTLKNIKGKFLFSYELEKIGLFKGFKTYRIKTLHTGSHQLGGARKEYELLVSNFPLKTSGLYVEKSLEFTDQVEAGTKNVGINFLES